MVLGFTKWFDNEKGFGVIESLDNAEYFLHIKNIDRKPNKVSTGTPFLFETSEFKGKKNAINAIIPDTSLHFAFGINLLIKNKGRITYTDNRNVTRIINTVRHFIETAIKDKESAFKFFKSGFDENFQTNWTIENVSEYYKITRIELNFLRIVSTEEESSIYAHNENSNTQNSKNIDINEVVSNLIQYYDSNFSEEEKFRIHSHDMTLGFTKSFDNDLGFGYLESLDNTQYRLKTTFIDRKPNKILIGTPFLFKKYDSEGTKYAFNAIVPKTNDDFAIGINLLIQKKGIITYQVTIKGESRWGNPYKREETRSMDTVGIFIRRLCKDKGLESIFELFKAGFDLNHNVNWDFESVSKYYEITEKQISGLDSVLTDEELNTRMKEDIKRNDGEFSFRHSSFFINQAKKELTERLIGYYDSKLSDEDFFDSWQLKLKESHFYGNNKSNIDIDEKVLVKYQDRLEDDSIKKIIENYNLSDGTFNLLVSPFFNKEIKDISSFESSLKIYNSLDKDLQPVYFDLLIGAITNDFYFDIWKNKKYNIDRDNKIISPSWGLNDDFNLIRGIYLENIDKIGITEIERINKLNSDDVELIKILLESVIKSEEFSSYKVEKLIVLLKNLENSFSTQILDDFFRINNSENLKFLHEISIRNLINLYEFYARDFIYETILEKIDFNISYELNLLLEVFDYSEDFTTFIKSKMSLSTTTFESFKTCLTYLEENDESLDVKIMAKVFEKELEIADIIEIQELSLKLELKDYEIIQRLISDYLNNKEVLYENEYLILLSINSQSFLESILSKSFEIKPQNYAHRSRDYKEGSDKTYLEALFDNNQAIKINKTIFLDFVRDKL